MRRFLRRTFLIVGTTIVVVGYGAMFLSALDTSRSNVSTGARNGK